MGARLRHFGCCDDAVIGRGVCPQTITFDALQFIVVALAERLKNAESIPLRSATRAFRPLRLASRGWCRAALGCPDARASPCKRVVAASGVRQRTNRWISTPELVGSARRRRARAARLRLRCHRRASGWFN